MVIDFDYSPFVLFTGISRVTCLPANRDLSSQLIDATLRSRITVLGLFDIFLALDQNLIQGAIGNRHRSGRHQNIVAQCLW